MTKATDEELERWKDWALPRQAHSDDIICGWWDTMKAFRRLEAETRSLIDKGKKENKQ